MDATTPAPAPDRTITDTWHDIPHYTCAACGYDTLQQSRITAHLQTCPLTLRASEEPKPPTPPEPDDIPEPEPPPVAPDEEDEEDGEKEPV